MITYPENGYRLLWAAPFCLHDSSSGAAMLVKLMLEQLVKRGIACQAVSALTFDSPNGITAFPDFEKQMAQNVEWFNVADKGVAYQYLKTASLSVSSMTREEEGTFYKGFLRAIEQCKPDALLLYGGGVLELSILAECKRRGIATVIYVLNGNYAGDTFPDADLLLTEVQASARQYYAKSRVNMLTTGTFIDPKKVLATGELQQEYITFINPHPSKGVSLFLRLATMAKERHPDWRFLVVESRGTWGQALAQYQCEPADFSNVDVAQHTPDIRQVYARTKLLLVPSLWYEGFGRVAAEAVMNGIPVVSSTSGGLPDAVNGGGLCIPAPQHCHDDFSYFPEAVELEAWMEGIENILHPDHYAEWQQKAQEAGKIHDIEMSTDRVCAYLKPLLARKASWNPHYFIR
jgi:glycosyltransferase involved in cell wall biosynthesis